MGLFSCFSPAELPPEQRDLIEMQKELQKVKHQLQEAQSDAASARKTLTIAIQRIGSTPSQPSSPSADAKDSPRIAASTAQSAPGTPTHADPQPKAVSNSGSTGSADAPAAGAGRSSADAQDLHAQVLFLERQLHGSGANTLSGLQQSNQRLVQQMDALNVRLLEARQVEELLRAEVADLQGELRQAKAIHDATVSETNKLMRDCSALKASYMQLAGEAKLKEDMVGLLQQQLEELSQQLPDMAQEIAGDTPELQGLGVTASEGTEVAALRKPRITDASRSLSMPVQKVPLAQDPRGDP